MARQTLRKLRILSPDPSHRRAPNRASNWQTVGALALSFALAAPSLALAKPRGKKGGAAPAPAPAAPTMTFEPEAVQEKPAAKPAAKPAGAPPAAKTVPGAPPAAAPPEGEPLPPSKTLERALKLYDQEDYYSATIELNKVIEGQTTDDAGNRERAEFFMGKALFQMKYYSASLSYFDRIVQKGPTHRYHRKTMQWLASLSQFLPDSSGVLEKIGKYSRPDLEQPELEPVRDQLYYLLGRFHYMQGSPDSFNTALELFQAVPEKSEYFAKSKYLEGMTYVRQYQAKPAAEAFKNILRKSIERPDKATKEVEELANLALARTFYALRQFPQAVKYYDKIENTSPEWLAALFEASWAHFQMDGDSKALGNIHTINAPYFDNEFYPESLVLKAVIYFQRCNYDRAMDAVNEFNVAYPGLKKDIDAIIAKYPDNAQFFEYVLKIRENDSGLPERVQRAAEGALADRTLVKSLDYVAELDRELRQVDRSDPAWKSTAVAGTILQDLTLQRSLATNDAGNLARERLKRLSEEVQRLVKEAIKVEYETLNAQKGVIEAAIKQEQAPQSGDPTKKAGTVVLDDEHERWPFQGEYWKDELGYYRFKVVNKCEGAGDAGAGGGASSAPAEPPADAPASPPAN